MKRLNKFIIFLLIALLSLDFVSPVVKATGNVDVSPDAEAVKARITEIYKDRCSMFVSGDMTNLPSYFNANVKVGAWSFEHEVKRIQYLRDWAAERGMNLENVESELDIGKVSPSSHGLKMRVNEYYKFQYSYKSDPEKVKNAFGVGIIHTVVMSKKNDNWVIHNDWYTDCFEDALKKYDGNVKNLKLPDSSKQVVEMIPCARQPVVIQPVQKGKYDRLKAVAYANKYCGIPWASGNPKKYNSKYTNFTGAGGNCTNYVSQCLGDKEEGGGLPFGGGWYCQYKKYDGAECSRAWVNADGFKDYLLYSGRGSVIKKGSFKDVIKPLPDSPCGAVGKLQVGDVICYAKGSDIDHFAIVTGFDSHGYPLINSHTTDRYRVPWDLGWGDKGINFYLIHIR